MGLIKPIQKDKDLLEDIQGAYTDDNLRIWWLGQSGYVVRWKDTFLLIDPYLSDSLTKKYAKTDKPHVRMTELVIDPAELDFMDLVTSSHNHTDHLDRETLLPILKNSNTKMIIPEANRNFVSERLDYPTDFFLGLNDGENVKVGNIEVYGIPAAHEGLDRDKNGNCLYMGYIFHIGPFKIYHSGDTIWHDEIINSLETHSIDIALLPINGSAPERRVAGNLNSEEAVELGLKIGAKVVIPCHYDMFTFNTADVEDFVSIANNQNLGFKVLQCGQKFEYKVN